MALQLLDDFEEEDFSIFGISSKVMDEVKFIYSINRLFKTKFKRQPSLDIQWDDQIFCYSLYSHSVQKDFEEFFIIKNLSHPSKKEMDSDLLFSSLDSERSMLRNHKHFDYLLKIPYYIESDDINPLPLNEADFISDFSLITNLSNKDKKLFFI